MDDQPILLEDKVTGRGIGGVIGRVTGQLAGRVAGRSGSDWLVDRSGWSFSWQQATAAPPHAAQRLMQLPF